MQQKKSSNPIAKQLPYHQPSLQSIRRTSSKPWRKAVVAPLPRTPPRVYKVDPINFRDLVQSLTCAPEFLEARTLQSAVPPLIDIHVSSVPNRVPSPTSKNISSPFSVMYKDLYETLELSSSMPNHQKTVHDRMVDSSDHLRVNLQSPSSDHTGFLFQSRTQHSALGPSYFRIPNSKYM